MDMMNVILDYINKDELLVKSSKEGRLDIVECLISHGADIHYDNDQALRWASNNGHLAVVECLLSHGAEGLRHSWRCS
jgi:ankyrin repeat protein